MTSGTTNLRAGAGAHPGAPAVRLLRYLGGRLPRWQRALVGGVGLALLPVMFVPVLPLWKIFLVAPQYREGLTMKIYIHDLRGDLQNINILNHYIGMQQIKPESFPEFGYMPWVISAFGLVAILAALVGRRWLAFVGWAGFAGFGTVMMLHFAQWLRDYGTNLDPKAALKIGAFTPPLLGTNVLGNFTATSLPEVGGYILLASGLLGPVIVLFDLIAVRRRGGSPLSSSAGAALAGCLVLAWAVSAEASDFTSYAPKASVSVLQAAADALAPGDTLRIPAGVHPGGLVLDKPLVVLGDPGAVLAGEGRGTVLTVRGNGTVLRGFTVTGSGWQLLVDDAGILVDEADDVLIEKIELRDTNHGIYVRNALRTVIRGCGLEGRKGKVPEENHGNALHVWYTRDTLLEGNRITGHRDGIYLSFAESARIVENLAWDLDRFGLHSMYSQKITMTSNTFTRNVAGVALMFSNRMVMDGNLFTRNRGHRTYGLLLKDCSDSEFRHNRFTSNTVGLFLDGSNRNRFERNLVAENGWGAIVYSSSESNVFTGNSFLDNDFQVSLDMRRTRNRVDDDGAGNYWSDARPYDLDGDGRGDAPHCPVAFFAFISKQYPDLTVFAGSPAVLALDMAQRAIPALTPTELADPHPALEAAPMEPFSGPPPPGDRGPSPGAAGVGVLAALAALSGSAVLFRIR